jgi:hypothetical protein
MISMKLDKQAAQNYTTPPLAADAPAYPYGLTICLSSESLEKLGLDKSLPTVGARMALVAIVEVTSVRSEKTQGGEARAHADLQITEMELLPARREADPKSMYPNSNMA